MTAEIGAATVNWVTQGSFAPPLVVVGVKADSGAHTAVKGTGRFALCWARVKRISPSPSSNRPRSRGGKLSGQTFHAGTNGAPILDNAIATVDVAPAAPGGGLRGRRHPDQGSHGVRRRAGLPHAGGRNLRRTDDKPGRQPRAVRRTSRYHFRGVQQRVLHAQGQIPHATP
jgi:hypothetical protein